MPARLARPGRGASALRRGLAATTVLAAAAHLAAQTSWARMGTAAETLAIAASFLPDPTVLPELAKPLAETIVIAFWGTLIGALMSLPVAVLAAANVTPSLLLAYPLARALVIVSRSVHEIIFALIFVAALGLGALPGVCTLAVMCFGFLGKTVADAIETARPGPMEALAAVGAGPLARLRYAVVPQVLATVLGNAIFQFDINLRRAAMLGMVGAGGIGLTFSQELQNYRYARGGACFVAILVVVAAAEWLSDRVRGQIAADAGPRR